MATRYAVQAGDWSDSGTWDGGTLPDSTDDVHANGFAVSINQSVTVNSLRTTSNASPTVSAGGSFTITDAATVTITSGLNATTWNGQNSTYLLTVNAGSDPVTLVANVKGYGASARNALLVHSSYTGTLTVNGNVEGGSAGHGMTVSGGTVIVNGNVQGGTSGGFGIDAGSGTLTVHGDVTATSTGFGISVGTGASVAVDGHVSGGTSTNMYGIRMQSSGELTVAGALSGGSGARAHGVGVFSGAVRLDAEMRHGANGAHPYYIEGSSVSVQFVRGGTDLALVAPSDDDWPADTGEEISLTLGGGGVEPKRFLNVGGEAVPIQ